MTHNRDSNGYFAHERLAAYQLALEALRFIAQRKHQLHGLPGGLGGQLERGVVGAFSNLCAGAPARRREALRDAVTSASASAKLVKPAAARRGRSHSAPSPRANTTSCAA